MNSLLQLLPRMSSQRLIVLYSWQKTYALELQNHTSDPTDIGTVWFSDSAAEEKVLDFLSSEASSLGLNSASNTFLDLGCGNGSMLFALREEEWKGPMVGVDYAAECLELARSVAAGKGLGSGEGEVRFEVWDVLRDAVPVAAESGWMPEGGFDVVLDKGTFDAISLSAELDAHGRRVCEGYKERVEGLVRRGGVLLVTSCNWTEEELEKWLTGGDLDVVGRVQYPSFSFGGRKGQTISTVCFRRQT